MPAALLVLLLACAAVAQAGRLTGSVVDASGDPVEGAYVQALAGEPRDVVAQAQTNGNGRYAFEAPAGLFTLTVTAHGYYVLAAGGLDSDTITHSCPAVGECGEVNFRLGKPGVVEGWLTDRFGEPVSGVRLMLRLADTPSRSKPGFAGTDIRGRAASDDRGYFRMWNLRPGRYLLESDSRVRPFPEFRQTFHLPPQEVEIGEQAETVELRLSVDSEESLHTISGVVEGLGAQEGGSAAIALMPKSSDSRAYFVSHVGLRGGHFSIPGLKTGDYVLRLAVWKSEQEANYRLLGEFHVDRDMTGLRLTPQPEAGIHLKVDFGEIEKRNLYLRLWPAGGPGIADYVSLQGPDYETTHAGISPGDYELRLYSDDCYLAQPYRITVQAGQITPLTIQIGSEFASLRGRVRVTGGARRAGASHFTVGARGPHGRYKTQADADGRFAFEKLPPGSYRLAAWPKPNINVEDDLAWSDAAGVASEIELEPGFDVEVDLTALP